MEEASRFGILNTYEDGTIYEFDEKPAVPKSNKASMGIYVFTWSKLKKFLEEDELDLNSKNDFGHDVLPKMLNSGEKMVAYDFDGYWKDVGTIESLWEANMDILNPQTHLDLRDDNWKIFTRNPVMPPQYVGDSANIQNSMVAEGSDVEGNLDFSIVSHGVQIGKGATVKDSIIMPGAVIEENAVVQYAIIGEKAVVGKGCTIGGRPEDKNESDVWGIAVIGPDCVIPENTVVAPKAMIDVEGGKL